MEEKRKKEQKDIEDYERKKKEEQEREESEKLNKEETKSKGVDLMSTVGKKYG